MFSKRNLGAVHNYINGTLLDARASVIPKEDDEETKVDITKRSTIDISSLREDKTLAASRWGRSAPRSFCMKDEIVGVQEGSRVSTTTVGRTWGVTNASFKTVCVEGLNFGSKNVALVPAVAAMATKDMDASSISAWTNTNIMLGSTTNAGPPDFQVMAAMLRVHNTSTNTVRFVHRLAALYLHALWSENKGDTLNLHDKPNCETINNMGNLQTNVGRAQVGVQFIPWFSPGNADDSTVMSVLLAAGSKKVRSSVKNTRFLHVWPPLGDEVVLLCENQAQAGGLRLRTHVELTSSTIWYAAVRWVARYSDAELWDEALDFLSTICVSPSKGLAIIPDAGLQYALPPSNMGAFCVGKFINPQQDLALSDSPSEPDPTQIIEGGVLRALVLGLCSWNAAWKVCGWYFANGKCDKANAQEYWRRFGYSKSGVPVWRTIQTKLSQLISGDIGRLFCTISPQTEDLFEHLSDWQKRALQFDEIFTRSKKVFNDTAIYGLISPIIPKRTDLTRGVWGKLGDLPEDRSPNHAYYSMLGYSSTTLMTTAPGWNCTQQPITVPRSYRGEYTDYALLAGTDQQGNDFEPIFCVTDKALYYEVTDPTSQRYNLKWYVEEPTDSPVRIAPIAAEAKGPPPMPTKKINIPEAFPLISDDEEGDASDISSNGSEDDEFEGDHDAGSEGHEVNLTEEEKAEAEKEVSHSLLPDDVAKKFPALAAALDTVAHAGENKDRGPIAQAASYVKALYEKNVDPELCNAFYSLVVQPVSDSATRPEVDALLNMSPYDILVESDAPHKLRFQLAEAIKKLTFSACRNVPPGQTLRHMMGKYFAAAALSRAMATNTALTGEEYVQSLNLEGKRKLDVVDLTDQRNRLLSTGRLPTRATCRTLLESGNKISEGIARRGTRAANQVVSEPKPAQDDISAMVKAMVDSAWDAGVDPALSDLREMVGPSFELDEMIVSLVEAKLGTDQFTADEFLKALLPGTIGGQGTGKVEEITPPWLQPAIARALKRSTFVKAPAYLPPQRKRPGPATVESVSPSTAASTPQSISQEDVRASLQAVSAATGLDVATIGFLETPAGESGGNPSITENNQPI